MIVAVSDVLWVVTTVLALSSLVTRFRHAHGDERQQVKWVVMGAAMFVLTFILGGVAEGISEDLSFAILMSGFLFISAGVAVAMLRYRLYDIDVVINRALVYGSLTAMLAASTCGSVLLLQLALGPLTGGSGLAVAASTLGTLRSFARPRPHPGRGRPPLLPAQVRRRSNVPAVRRQRARRGRPRSAHHRAPHRHRRDHAARPSEPVGSQPGRSTMTARLLAWSLCSITMVIAAARLALAILDPASSDSSSGPHVPGGGIPVAAFEACLLVMLAVIGAVIASRQPRNAVGWIFCVIPALLGPPGLERPRLLEPRSGRRGSRPGSPAGRVAWVGLGAGDDSRADVVSALVSDWSTLDASVATGGVGGAATLILSAFSEAFKPGPFDEGYPVDNPFGGGAGSTR